MAHPLIDAIDELSRPARSARELGFRMPAEWERQACVWLTEPHNESTWPGCLDQALGQWEKLVTVLRKRVEVKTTQDLNVQTDDSWIRDYGPIFVVNDEGGLACHDFIFNCWGGKYSPWDHDDVVPQHIARALGVPLWVHDIVLEGGSIEVNGVGTVMTTEQCLLHPSRNAHLTRDEIEATLNSALGTRHVIWLPGGIDGDDTDGHIDDVARFVNPSTVVAVHPGEGHPDYITLERNWQALRSARDQDGGKLELIALPAPQPIHYTFPPDEWSIGGRRPVPASYANFLISNRAVFVPTFGQTSDDAALAALETALPGYEIHPVRAEWLVIGLGAFHCLSQQQPRA
jgi:agmatine deiminase